MARGHGPSVAAEVENLGTSRRFLDQIEFRCDPGSYRPVLLGVPTLEVWINGEHITRRFRRCGVPARSQAVPACSLGDAPGRRTVALSVCRCGSRRCSNSCIVMSAWGRFVAWDSSSLHHLGTWVFDRGLYRESYQAAMADYYTRETRADAARRWLLEQRIFDAAEDMGLEVRDVMASSDGRRTEVHFCDDFRGCRVIMTWPANFLDPMGSVRTVAQAIARWDVDSLPARWLRFREPFAIPHYPPNWSEHQLSSAARLAEVADGASRPGEDPVPSDRGDERRQRRKPEDSQAHYPQPD